MNQGIFAEVEGQALTLGSHRESRVGTEWTESIVSQHAQGFGIIVNDAGHYVMKSRGHPKSFQLESDVTRCVFFNIPSG